MIPFVSMNPTTAVNRITPLIQPNQSVMPYWTGTTNRIQQIQQVNRDIPASFVYSVNPLAMADRIRPANTNPPRNQQSYDGRMYKRHRTDQYDPPQTIMPAIPVNDKYPVNQPTHTDHQIKDLSSFSFQCSMPKHIGNAHIEMQQCAVQVPQSTIQARQEPLGICSGPKDKTDTAARQLGHHDVDESVDRNLNYTREDNENSDKNSIDNSKEDSQSRSKEKASSNIETVQQNHDVSQEDQMDSMSHPLKRIVIAKFSANDIVCTESKHRLSVALAAKQNEMINHDDKTDHRMVGSTAHSRAILPQLIDKGTGNNENQKPSMVSGSAREEDESMTDVIQRASLISPIPKGKPRSTEDPLRPRDGCLHVLKKFLSSKENDLMSIPSKFRGEKGSDDLASYHDKKRLHENRPPKIAYILTQIIPPILHQKSYRNHQGMEKFTSSHKEVLTKLRKLTQCSGSKWEGIYLFIPWTNMTFTRYCLDTTKPLHPSLNLIEAHRRILKMESACTKLVEFLSATVWGARKHLRRIAPKHLADAYAVFISESRSTQSDVSDSHQSSTSYEDLFDKLSTRGVSTSTSTESILLKAAAFISDMNPSIYKSTSSLSDRCKWLKENRRYSTH